MIRSASKKSEKTLKTDILKTYNPYISASNDKKVLLTAKLSNKKVVYGKVKIVTSNNY